MRRTIMLLTTMALSLLMASGIAVAEPQLDQQQTLTDGGYAVVDDDTNAPLGQTFTAGISGHLDEVSLYVGCCADSSSTIRGTPPDVPLVVYIRGLDSSGLPHGDLIGFGTVPAGAFSGDGTLSWVDVPLTPFSSSGGVVAAGKQYAITVSEEAYSCPADASITCDPPNTGGFMWGRTTPSAYSGGTALAYSGAEWQSQSEYDFAFKTFVSVDPTPPRVTNTVPATNATGVSPQVNVKAKFSEGMRPSTINTTSFKLFKKGSTTKIDALVYYEGWTDSWVLDPTIGLRSGTTYKAVVTTGAEDWVGNHLDQNREKSGDQPKRWFFTVGN